MDTLKHKAADLMETIGGEKGASIARNWTGENDKQGGTADDMKKQSMSTNAYKNDEGVCTNPSQSRLPENQRAVVFYGKEDVRVESVKLSKYLSPRNEYLPHAVLCKVVLSNICGSDLHMYRGRADIPKGMVLGHEITAEIVEKGPDVQFLNVGDLVSVPFNISCGRCQNCKEMKTNGCLHMNPKMPGAAYGYAQMGGWQGGQSEYLLVPFADHNCLRFPDKQLAMTKILDLAMLSDILPTAYHGCVQAGVQAGHMVFIAGAGPVGICAAASALHMGAACVIVADINPSRLDAPKQMGCLTIDLSQVKPDTLNVQIKKLTGYEFVDCAVECVGYEASGCCSNKDKNVPCEGLNLCILATKAGGKIGVPGVFVNVDPNGPDAKSKVGEPAFMWGELWSKAITLGTGQCPVSQHNYYLMQSILFGRLSVHKYLNVKVIGLDDVPKAYKDFNSGTWVKYVIDPFNTLKMRNSK